MSQSTVSSMLAPRRTSVQQASQLLSSVKTSCPLLGGPPHLFRNVDMVCALVWHADNVQEPVIANQFATSSVSKNTMLRHLQISHNRSRHFFSCGNRMGDCDSFGNHEVTSTPETLLTTGTEAGSDAAIQAGDPCHVALRNAEGQSVQHSPLLVDLYLRSCVQTPSG
jgi:hypothetical protein